MEELYIIMDAWDNCSLRKSWLLHTALMASTMAAEHTALMASTMAAEDCSPQLVAASCSLFGHSYQASRVLKQRDALMLVAF